MKLVAITRRLAFAVFAGALAATPAMAQVATYDGDWEGVLEVPNGPKLRLELHIKTDAGTTTALLDSLDQGIAVPSTAVKTDQGQIEALYMSLMGELKGKLSTDGKVLDATWTQGATLPVTFKRKAGK